MKIKLIIEIECTATIPDSNVTDKLIDNICESMPGVIILDNEENDIIIDGFEIYELKDK